MIPGGIELRAGRWQDALKKVGEIDSMITDPPYSARNVRGFRSGSQYRRGVPGVPERSFVIPYEAWTEDDARELMRWAVVHVAWWVVAFGDHIVWSWLDRAFRDAGWYVFAPIIWGKPNPPPRMAADGPCCAAEHILVARRRGRLPKERRGSRRGLYNHKVMPAGGAADQAGRPAFRLVGAKPLDLMMAVVSDYARPGDLVVDPFAGSGTTLVACARRGVSAIGAERDPETYAHALARLEREGRQIEIPGLEAA